MTLRKRLLMAATALCASAGTLIATTLPASAHTAWH